MATKLIAVDGFSYSFSDPLVNASVSMIGVPSVKNKAGGSGICKDGFNAIVSSITYPSAGATTPDPVPYTVPFNATATKIEADGTLVLRLDDETDTINATPMIPGTPPTPYPVSFKLKISDAGQTKVKGA